jgi:hypothetical protein
LKAQVENLLSASIKIVQCDNGIEFKPLVTQYPAICFQFSCPYTPEQNGLAERKHRHIVELGLASMSQVSILLQYWTNIFNSVVFVINRLPSSVVGHKSPFELLFHQQPDYTFFRILGCECYPLLRPYNSHKLENRSEACVFLGYCTHHKGYKCFHISSGRLYISRHVTFNEHVFPSALLSSAASDHSPPSSTTTTLIVLPLSSVTSFVLPTPSPPSLPHLFIQ